MKASRNWLKTYFEKDIPTAEKLAEIFALKSSEVEGVEAVPAGASESSATDYCLDIKVLPDRAHYALCHEGLAREISVMTGQPLKANRIPAGPKADNDNAPTVKVEVPEFCRRYMARYVELNGDANKQVSAGVCSFLNTIGQRNISPIVDSTNMVMFDVGQPMHAFDADKVKGTIVVRSAKAGEKMVLLDDREVELLATDHVIADDEGPLVIAGVKGGKRAEISATTKRIILESANFHPTAVRKTSTRLDLRSDSSKRYENEITPELTAPAMDNVCALIHELYPNAKFGRIEDIYPKKAVKTVIKFAPTYIKERLGLDVPLADAKKILEAMDIVVEGAGNGAVSAGEWTLTIPFVRLDLLTKEDIVEEVGRIYGYDKITGVLPPKTDKKPEILPIYYISEMIRNILVDVGFSEVSLYTLVEKGDVEVAKPLARDKAFARKTLVDGMLACVEKNALNADLLGLDTIKVFEIGHVFSNVGERTMLTIGASQVKKVKGVNGEKIIGEVLNIIGTKLGVNFGSQTSSKPVAKGSNFACEIDLTEVAKQFKLPADTSYLDLKLGASSANRYQKFSLYPFMVRDIAIFVPENITSDEVWTSIKKGIADAGADALLVRHALFDAFKKDGKVSYAFRLVFQSIDRTLTDDEANGIMEKINAVVKGNGWVVR